MISVRDFKLQAGIETPNLLLTSPCSLQKAVRWSYAAVATARSGVFYERLGISIAFATAGRARNASNARVTCGKSAMPTRSPAS